MKNVVTLCATALALMIPATAQAQNFGADGSYDFQGSVSVIKNLPFPTICQLDVNITVSGSGSAATATPTLSGSPLCNAIDSMSFTAGSFAISANTGVSPTQLTLSGVDIGIPPVGGNPADACLGTLVHELYDGSVPRLIDFTTPLSDVDYVNPGTPNDCKIVGTIEQISGNPTGIFVTP
jgi:hypothetical protein